MAAPPDIRSPENWNLFREQASNATNQINHMPWINSNYNSDSTLIGNVPAKTASDAAVAAYLASQPTTQTAPQPAMQHYSQVDFTGNTYNPQTGKWSISDSPNIDWSTVGQQPASPTAAILAPDPAMVGSAPVDAAQFPAAGPAAEPGLAGNRWDPKTGKWSASDNIDWSNWSPTSAILGV